MATILDRIAERQTQATDSAFNARQKEKDCEQESRALGYRVGYHEGRNSALNEAEHIIKHELARLKNKFQNGSLSMDDFPN